jgi:hypothetical protein
MAILALALRSGSLTFLSFPPKTDQSSVPSIDRIPPGLCDTSDPLDGFRSIPCVGAFVIGPCRGIGSDDQEILARLDKAMAGPCRQNGYIAGGQSQAPPSYSAKFDLSPTACHAEYFVDP